MKEKLRQKDIKFNFFEAIIFYFYTDNSHKVSACNSKTPTIMHEPITLLALKYDCVEHIKEF